MTVENYLAEAVALAGWMRSRTVGILTTISLILSACLITYAITKVALLIVE